ncbi:MAG: hypothetical protein IJH67_04910 [Thermoguttaceae bacterium]|nr:hypothetical protein [Thermoguttaceae bacterium]
MNRRHFIAAAASGFAMAASAFADGSTTIPFETFKPYFVLNTIKPEKGKTSKFGVCTTMEQFESLFHPAAVMFFSRKQKFVAQDYFNDHVILYWVEWGNTPWQYTVQSVEQSDSGLLVKYSRQGEPSETAYFAPILLVGVKKTALSADGNVAFQLIGK